jgi:hypothetical protein
MTLTTLTFEELDAILAMMEMHDWCMLSEHLDVDVEQLYDNNLIRLVEDNNQYNDDEDVEFWGDILIRLNQEYRHCLNDF